MTTAQFLVWAALAAHSWAHVFPYVPTQMLPPTPCFNASACSAPDLLYIFSSSSSDGDGAHFLSLNVSGTVGASDQPVPLADLPFDGGGAFGAARAETGVVYAYAAESCGGDASGTLWRFENGAWGGRSIDKGGAKGPSYLGGTMAFSATLVPTVEEPAIYTYGGMCATPDASGDATTWQEAAEYTRSMVSLEPAKRGGGYVMDSDSEAGPRAAMAGFSLTPLRPSTSNLSGIVTQQTGHLVLGGHTSQAFINMSTAAVWSLPEESWTYVDVHSPPGLRVDSRSGHTSVLSEDGRSVVVMGGWVGDVSVAAHPQLVALTMGQAYSDWQWVMPPPEQQPNATYGHGAAVLPGNVMVVYGGWTIGGPSSSSSSSSSSSTPALRFLNLTSMSWSTTYTNPQSVGGGERGSESGGVELGVGLGVGLALLVAALTALICWRMKLRRQKSARDDAIRAMAQDASQFIHDDEMLHAPFYSGGQDPWRTGISYGGGYAPVRKPVFAARGAMMRGGYVPTANPQISPGQIHPIMEDEEEEEEEEEQEEEEQEVDIVHQTGLSGVMTPISEAASDPFATPTQAHQPMHMPPPPPAATATAITTTITPTINTTAAAAAEGVGARDPDVQDWVEDLGAADALLTRYNNRRGANRNTVPSRRSSHRSAHKDDDSRTGSNLSESNRSATDSLQRTQSGRWSAVAAGLFNVGAADNGNSSSSSYNTAKSGFGALQAQGPHLLLGRGSSSPDEPSSPTKSSKPQRRSWLGSIRRVFSNADESLEEIAPQVESAGECEPPLSGLGGELLRRKQGRVDWEGEGRGTPDSEWDLERAVERRLVQIMFTVPRERLRVVNAADEESLREGQRAEVVQADEEEDDGQPRQHEDGNYKEEEKEGERDEEEQGSRRLSRSTTFESLQSSLFTAEAVMMERPKTRVLRMVDSIERGQTQTQTQTQMQTRSQTHLGEQGERKSSRSLRSLG